MRLIHLESCGEGMEPHAIDYFCHIFRPFNLIHLLNDIISYYLLVYGALYILGVIEQLSWLVIQTLIKFGREHCILVNLSIF